MPRPARRTRAVVRTKESEAVTAPAATTTTTATETEATKTSSPAPTRHSRRSDAASVSQTPNVGSRRTSARHAATTAATATSASKTSATSAKTQRKAPTPRLARGPDASGLDMMDDTFADIDSNFGDNALGDLSDLEDLGNLDDLDADLDAFGGSPAAAAPNADTTAASTSSFNVGLFRRGRPRQSSVHNRGRRRQSSVHSRDDAPIRPSSRSGNSSATLGTFKRRVRESSIVDLSRGTSRGPSRDASREPSRMHSRHTSRDRGAESESELDGTAVTVPQYNSDAEASSVSNALLNTRRAARSTRTRTRTRTKQAAQAVQAADTSVASSANTTSMLLMGRTRTQAAGASTPTTTTTSRKRKSLEDQRENELPKRRSRGIEAAASAEMEAEAQTEADAGAEEADMGDAAAEPRSDISIVPSIEAAEEDVIAVSSPLSSAASSTSVRLSDAELRRRYTTPGGPNDEIMAPPMSSDSESGSPTLWPTLKGLAKGVRRGKTTAAASVPMLSRQTPELVDDDIASDISSPPSLTHSPNLRAAAGKKPATRGRTAVAPGRGPNQKDVAPLTTAALAALLPQRHRRARAAQRSGSHDADEGENELERSALLSEDDDELAHHASGSHRRGRSASGLGAAAQTQSHTRGRSKTADDRSKSKSKKRRRTYGTRGVSGVSDKENQEDQENPEMSAEPEVGADDSTFAPAGDTLGDDDTLLPSASTRTARSFGEELEKAAVKFKEVDKWSLEYESVSRSSSPVDAR